MPILIGLAVVVILLVALIAFIATRPEDFHIERSAVIAAPAEVIFPLLNDFHNWARWSPFEKYDPNMKKAFEGAATGVGAVYTWKGNKKAGEGRITITESRPGELVSSKLEFLKPFPAVSQASFKLVPASGGTQVTWAMDGKNNFTAKAFHAMVNIDKMVGKDFAEGLANLNTAAQAELQKVR